MIYSYESGKADPSDEMIARMSGMLGVTTEKFASVKFKAEDFNRLKVQAHVAGIEKEARKAPQDDYKDKYIASLEKQVSLLEDQVNSLSGQIRHMLALALAKVSTNQTSLADLLVKQKIEPAEKVEDRLSRENGENYLKVKAAEGIV